MSFWNPVKVSEGKQLETDRRVIIRLGKEKLLQQQKKVSARLEKQREKVASADYTNTSKRVLSKLRNDYTFTLKELESINRRIDICDSELNLK